MKSNWWINKCRRRATLPYGRITLNKWRKERNGKSSLKPQHYHIKNHCKQAPLIGNKLRKWKFKVTRIFLHSLKISPPKYLKYKWRNSHCPVEKFGRYHLYQVIKVSITSSKTATSCLPDMMHWGTFPWEFFPGMRKFNLITRKHQEIQIEGPSVMCLTVLFKRSRP